MKTRLKMYCVSCLVTLGAVQLSAQTYHWIHSSENDTWQQSIVRLKSEVNTLPDVSVDGKAKIATFKTWGVTFNELCWDALGVLTREEQDEILKKVFAPDGDLRIGRGRISLGANDYGWKEILSYATSTSTGINRRLFLSSGRHRNTIRHLPFGFLPGLPPAG